MNMRIFWTILLIGFVGVNISAFATAVPGDLQNYLSNLGPWGILAGVDLILALIVAASWTAADAKRKGLNPIPYVILTMLTGSLALLYYLVRHTGKRGKAAPSEAPQ